VVEAIVEPLMAAAAPPVASDVVELDPVESFEAVEPLERAEPRAPFEPRESFDHREPIESSEPRESVEPLEPVFDLSDEIAALAAEPDEASAVEEFAGEPVGIYTMPALDEEEIVEAPVAAEAVASEESPAQIAVEEMAVEEIAATADVEPIAAFVSIEPIEVVAAAEPVAAEPIATPAAFAEFAAFEDDEPIPEPRVAVVAPMMLSMERLWPALEGVPIEMPSTERTEWSALVASLRQDIEQRAARPPQPAMKSGNRTQAPKKRQKPVQDEWGFFDPEQCGFSALLAKLDEITGEEARG
jgi:hypothetical protein